MKESIEYIYNQLESVKRGEKNIIVVKDNAPENVKDFIRDVHGTEFLPDDYRFDTIHSILSNMLQYDDLEENSHEIIDGLVSIYNYDLTSWLSSNNLRHHYCDEAVCNSFVVENSSIIERLQAGQYQEISELYYNIINELELFEIEEAA